MDEFSVSVLGAFAAGILSFVSPCILPIVPASLCFLGGTSLDRMTADGENRPANRRVVIAAIAFVLGFATIFVALGATASTLGRFLADYKEPLAKVAGVIIVLFGLHFMGVFRIGILNFEKRFHIEGRPTSPAGAYLAGLAFAFGWTPCVGPVLATILTLAAGGPTPSHGIGLLLAYAAGIGLPFIAAAAAMGPFLRWAGRVRRHMRTIEIAIGTLLVATGAAIFFGQMAEIAQWMIESVPAFARFG